jgi:branched-chain amino acid transport system permease protein
MRSIRSAGGDTLLGSGAVVLVALAAPFVLTGYQTSQLAQVAIFAIAILGLNLLTGFSGQVSLGHGAFMAVGGYTTAILAGDHGVPVVLTIPIAAVVSGASGFLFGIPALRLSGLYLSLATFGMAVSVPTVVRKLEGITHGSRGIQVPGVKAPFGMDLTPDQVFYLVAVVLAILLFLFAHNVVQSRTGRALMAIREGELAASAFGVNLALYKTLAFGLSAFYAGIAGSLLAIVTSFVGPDLFPVTLSIFLLVGAVVGGLGSIAGPVFGAFLYVYLPIYAQQVSLPGSPSKVPPAIAYGVVLILVMFLMPNGISGLLRRTYATVRVRYTMTGPGGERRASDGEEETK